jgi:hypothetical protein
MYGHVCTHLKWIFGQRVSTQRNWNWNRLREFKGLCVWVKARHHVYRSNKLKSLFIYNPTLAHAAFNALPSFSLVNPSSSSFHSQLRHLYLASSALSSPPPPPPPPSSSSLSLSNSQYHYLLHQHFLPMHS